MEFSSLAAMASRPFAILKNRPTGTVSFYTANSSPLSASSTHGEATSSSASERLEAFQDWFVLKTRNKEWRRVNSAMLGDDTETGCLPGDTVTVFSFQQPQGNTLGGNTIVVGAIILSRQQNEQQQQQRNPHRACYYDKSCRVFLQIDEHTGNVVRQWTNLSTESATDVLLYRHMLEQLLSQTQEQTVVFRDPAALERANATGKLSYGDSALCLLEQDDSTAAPVLR
jgi:hypothetical protein